VSTTRWPVQQYQGFQQQRRSITVAGLATATNYELNAEPGSFAVTGVDATLVAARLIDGQPGTFTVTGTDATLVRGYPLDAQPATFTLTGVDATLLATRLLDGQPGSFTVTGTDATLVVGYALNAEPGSFAITGVDATLEYAPAVVAPPNTAIRAVEAHTPRQTEQVSQIVGALAASTNYELNAEPGSFAITGTDATLVAARVLSADPGEYTVSGVAAALEYAAVWAADVRAIKAHTPRLQEQTSQVVGALTTSGATNYELNAEPGSFSVTGLDAGLDYTLVWDKVVVPIYAITTPQIVYGSRVFGGVSEEAAATYELNAEPGAFTVTGSESGVVAARLLDAQPGSFTVTGAAATFRVTYVLDAGTGTFTFTGIAATFARPGVDLWQDHVPGSVLFTDHTAGTVTFSDHSPDSVLFTDHTPPATVTFSDHSPDSVLFTDHEPD
jgi:hypothetical protein